MHPTCPSCGERSHISAFFVEDDGKRLAACLAEMEPALGRAVIGYLGLFKPVKTQLRLARAAKIAQEVAELVAQGSVCKDERNGVRRKATPAMWAAAIETMLVQRNSLVLPLDGHGYLRSVVFTVSDKADAQAERDTEKNKQQGRHVKVEKHASETPMQRELNGVAHLVHLGQMSPETAEIERGIILKKFGVSK